MFLILAHLLILFILPVTAWAYFDPGFGGYLVGSVISWIITGLVFASSAVIYFFRTVIRQRLRIIIFLCALNFGSAALGAVLYFIFHRSFFYLLLLIWAYTDSNFGAFFGSSIIFFTFFVLTAISILLFHWQECLKAYKIIFLFVVCLVNFFLGAFLFSKYYKIPVDKSHISRAIIIDSQRMFKGYSLYNGKLINDQGLTVKQWSHGYLGAIDTNGDFYGSNQEVFRLDHQRLAWGRYTWDEKVIWEKHFPIHHELYLSPKGTIFTFIYETHKYNHYIVNFDVILEFDKNGKELQRYSLWDHLKEFQPYHAKFGIDSAFFPGTPLTFLWQKYFYTAYDYFHINSFFMIPPNPLEGKNPAFRPGNWLISMLHGSMVFILDQDTKKILWHAVANEVEGGLEGQHSASMLPDGNILLFDNGFNRLASRILIIDPLTLKIKWQFKNRDFFSPKEGFVEALPNGNLLVTESMKERIFEITPDKKIVWVFYDTNVKAGDIYRMTRYPKDMVDRFLQRSGSFQP